MKGYKTCPVCRGNGYITENINEIERTFTPPVTTRCHICSGKGYLGVRSKIFQATPPAPQPCHSGLDQKSSLLAEHPAPATPTPPQAQVKATLLIEGDLLDIMHLLHSYAVQQTTTP